MALLAAERISKRFPGVLALDGVSFDLLPGEIHALCGENGAGKSTLIKILAGIHPGGSYSGRLLVDGREQSFAGVAAAEAAGIAVIHQELALIPDLSVAENLLLGREPGRWGLVSWPRLQAEAAALLHRHAIQLDVTARVGDLGTGAQQLVEILRALGKRSRILVLDEPTAALTGVEVAVLLDILRELRRTGVGIVYISHKLDEVFAIADRITVLRDGRSVACHPADAVDRPRLIRDMVGRPIDDVFPNAGHDLGETVLSVADLAVLGEHGRSLEGLSFSVRRGEVLGIGGLMGAGRTELLLHLMGAWGRRKSGVVRFRDRPWQPASPRQAIAGGMVLVGEDRKAGGLVLEQGVGFNLSLSSLRRLGALVVDRARESLRNGAMAQRLRIKAPSLEAPAIGLSGGNQQKIVIGKALLTEPDLILLDEPTRGIDIGAKQEIYALLSELCAAGLAVVLVSSELPELLGLSDRIVMLAEGRQGGSFARGEADQEALMHAAVVGHVDAVETRS